MNRTQIEFLAGLLEAGELTARQLVEEVLQKAKDPAGEGSRVFVSIDESGALAAADAVDAQRAKGVHASPYAGIPISVKDLFDIRGQVTTAGSTLLKGEAAAKADAAAVANLRKAGFILIGRTNMTEFAYSGLGMNPHYGTPANPFERGEKRIPGGSSSGAAISLTDGMAFGAIGTDTGGSCRIPAALCGLVGYKPSADRVSRKGCFPLSDSQDSVGPLANSVRCAQILDALLAGEEVPDVQALALSHLRLAVPQSYVLDALDEKVAADFKASLQVLRSAGAMLEEVAFEEFGTLPGMLSKGGFVAAEAYHIHHGWMEQRPDEYDPRVIVRIKKGLSQSALDYLQLQEQRAEMIAAIAAKMHGFDAMIMPTVPTIAPTIASLDADEDLYGSTNLAMLRNPTVINFLDGCAISLPMHQKGTAPTGLMVAGLNGQDQTLFSIAHAMEKPLASR